MPTDTGAEAGGADRSATEIGVRMNERGVTPGEDFIKAHPINPRLEEQAAANRQQ
jgi:hypothetical protein